MATDQTSNSHRRHQRWLFPYLKSHTLVQSIWLLLSWPHPIINRRHSTVRITIRLKAWKLDYRGLYHGICQNNLKDFWEQQLESFFALCISLILRVVGKEDLVGVRPTSSPELLLTDLLIFVQSILGKSSEMSAVLASPLKKDTWWGSGHPVCHRDRMTDDWKFPR